MTTMLIITLLLWSAGWLLLGRMRSFGDGTGKKVSADQFSIIIPARNEAQNLPTLLRSIAAQSTRPSEIIVVNDASTDRTAEIARQSGARVLDSQPLPEGWRGKTWACHQGAEVASGAGLLFLDADTWIEPRGLDRLSGMYEGGALSLGPFHVVLRAYEELSLFFNFNMVVGTTPHGLFGQMLLVDRESYECVGGHAAVKGRTLENVFLASRLREAGIVVRSATGRGVLSFRMYPDGLRELVDGWTKGFASGARQTPGRVLLLVVAWMTGLMLAAAHLLATGDWLLWGVVYLLCAAQVHWFSRQIGSFRWLTALAYPVPLIFFFAVFARSAMRSGKQVTWKGRELRAD